MKTLADAPLQGKNVLLVVDYNVQIEDGRPVCTFKIDQTFPTIRRILQAGCLCLTIASHMGRPRGRDEFSMHPVYEYLRREFSGLEYKKCIRQTGDGPESNSGGRPSSRLFMTDNLRYYGEEELAVFYGSFETVVNDAFGCAHRKTLFRGFAGLLMAKEIEFLGAARRSDLVIMGGAKIGDKLRIMENFRGLVFAGGCLGLTLLRTLGIEIGRYSRYEAYDGSALRSRLSVGSSGACRDQDSPGGNLEEGGGIGLDAIILPVDFYVIEHSGDDKVCKIKSCGEISESDECIDIGPSSVECLRELVEQSRSIFWNGPVGKTESGRNSTSLLVAALEASRAEVVAGGGETLAAILEHSDVGKFSHISTGGGAMLQFLSGGEMPGIESLF